MDQVTRGQAVSALAQFHKRWKKNRDFLKGRDAVVNGGEEYLPKPLRAMKDDDYQNFLKRVDFYPAVIKVMESYLGLVFKKTPDLIGPADLETLEPIITREGDSLEVFAAKLMRETFTTNYTGLLDDHTPPPAGKTLSKANAIELGYRPYLAMFPAESILDLEFGIVGAKQGFTKVRLLENAKKELELKLVDGIYTVETWENVDGQWQRTDTVVPLRLGKSLTEIPFQIVSTRHLKTPQPAPFESMVDLNCEIWNLAGDHAQTRYWTINPIVVVKNVKPETDAEGQPIKREYPVGPGIVWETEGDTDVDVHSFDGKNLEAIDKKIASKKDEVSTTGSRILATQIAAPEAAETLAIRQESDNASLAGMVRAVQFYVENALKQMAWWLGAEGDVKFTLNTDFTPSQLPVGSVTDFLALSQAGKLTEEEEFHYLRRPGGFINPVVSFEDHQRKLSEQVIDRPISSAPPSGGAIG